MDGQIIAAVCVTLVAGLFAVDYLFGLYADDPRGVQILGRRWIARLDFTPGTLGGFSNARLVLVSGLGLFLEMMMIRWVSSEIRIFADRAGEFHGERIPALAGQSRLLRTFPLRRCLVRDPAAEIVLCLAVDEGRRHRRRSLPAGGFCRDHLHP